MKKIFKIAILATLLGSCMAACNTDDEPARTETIKTVDLDIQDYLVRVDGGAWVTNNAAEFKFIKTTGTAKDNIKIISQGGRKISSLDIVNFGYPYKVEYINDKEAVIYSGYILTYFYNTDILNLKLRVW